MKMEINKLIKILREAYDEGWTDSSLYNGDTFNEWIKEEIAPRFKLTNLKIKEFSECAHKNSERMPIVGNIHNWKYCHDCKRPLPTNK